MERKTEFETPCPELATVLTHLLAHASKDDTRPNICVVHFAEDAMVATDSHRMACVDLAFGLVCTGSIARADITTLLAMLKAAGKNGHALVKVSARGLVVDCLTNGQTWKADWYTDTPFPPYRRVIPATRGLESDTKVAGQAALNAKYVHEAMAFCAAARSNCGARIQYGLNALDPILVTPNGEAFAWGFVKGVRVTVMPERM